ncbi:hypothetical protein ABD91_20530 [Lysinibacillus sphaericus]|uniref:hypothetical protein n=1 Tax=Lysinibacillus sphaericus TaxID=1421 RepID=UPI0018CD0A89|nr:hypothetical protein [Lysinibacillus sphaericus]MBG9693130.1 hypothetical protein [Lysinibacillus sphaericus]
MLPLKIAEVSLVETKRMLKQYQLTNEFSVLLEEWVDAHSERFLMLYRGAAVHKSDIINGQYVRKGLSSWTFNKDIAYTFADNFALSVGGDYVPSILILEDGCGVSINDVLLDSLYPNEEEVVVADTVFDIIDVMPFEEEEDLYYELIVKPVNFRREIFI